MLILINITYQDTRTDIITNLLRRVLLMISCTRWIIQLYVYRISLPYSLRILFIKTTEVSLYPISLKHQTHNPSLQALACQPKVNQWTINKVLSFLAISVIRKWFLLERLALKLQLQISLSLRVCPLIFLKNLGSRRSRICQDIYQKVTTFLTGSSHPKIF